MSPSSGTEISPKSKISSALRERGWKGKQITEALLWEPEGDRVRCNLCSRRCLIPEGQNGFCQTRVNIDGTFYALNHRGVSVLGIDPIEKKPFFHYHPGTASLSISTVGCTFRCKFCQNYDISQEAYGMREVDSAEVARQAKRNGCRTISYTYNEPTVFFEYALDTAKEALKLGIENTFVTNGYMTPEAVEYAAPYIQAMTVGIKGSLNTEFYRRIMVVPNPEVIKDALLEMKRLGIHIEMTDLMVTKHGDSIEDAQTLARWVFENLGPDTPLHFTRFHPDWLLTDVTATPVKTLERAHIAAKEEGLRFVYIGNVPGHPLENTYCPGCAHLLVERHGFQITKWTISGGACPECGEEFPYRHSDGSGEPELRGNPLLFGLTIPDGGLACDLQASP